MAISILFIMALPQALCSQITDGELQEIYNHVIVEHENHLKTLKRKSLDNKFERGEYPKEKIDSIWAIIKNNRVNLIDRTDNAELDKFLERKNGYLFEKKFFANEDVQFMNNQLKDAAPIAFNKEYFDSPIDLVAFPENRYERAKLQQDVYYLFSNPVFDKQHERMLFTVIINRGGINRFYFLYEYHNDDWVQVLGYSIE
ncbi:hypothetical protein V1387_02205 [Allomuricauda taeanensis]|uniref:hypothetical protein n=1 Tax=Flagellimonas taeanensis TaxID=1005926 RepID=UPI002E7C5609|nr:hypothetical protein [Allomuricauda taeanensis]MEE1961482.1 hypothetical protein [Allomuricauda taeanensis]